MSGWISINKELPLLGHIVLTWSPVNECVATAALQHTQTNTYEWFETGAAPGKPMVCKVTHWMPCPKGPEK